MNKIGAKRDRDSNFELLRLCCIFGILIMHTYSEVFSVAQGGTLFFGVIINSLFNACVSIFILISGYFSIQLNYKKMIKLEMIVLFYSIIGLIIEIVFMGNIEGSIIVKSFIPIISRKYWFITCYFVLALFSPFINLIPEKLSKERFEQLLLLLLFVFCVVPTLFKFEIMLDNGKGVINMLLVYLIGKYIRLYISEDVNLKKISICLFLSIIVNILLNSFTSMRRGGVGVYAPFARDCSITMLILAILVFLLFRLFVIKSKIINKLASSVFAIYIFSEPIRLIVNSYIDIKRYLNSDRIYLAIFCEALLVFIICICCDIVRNATIGKIEEPLADLIVNKHYVDHILKKISKGYKIIIKWLTVGGGN